VPKVRKVTHGSFVVDRKERKEERERTRLAMGGDKIEYPGSLCTHSHLISSMKSLCLSGISSLRVCKHNDAQTVCE
jgi:hypothetical protein